MHWDNCALCQRMHIAADKLESSNCLMLRYAYATTWSNESTSM